MGLDGSQDCAEQGIGEDSLYNVEQGGQGGNMAVWKKTQKIKQQQQKNGVETRKMLLKMVIEIRVMGIKPGLIYEA